MYENNNYVDDITESSPTGSALDENENNNLDKDKGELKNKIKNLTNNGNENTNEVTAIEASKKKVKLSNNSKEEAVTLPSKSENAEPCRKVPLSEDSQSQTKESHNSLDSIVIFLLSIQYS